MTRRDFVILLSLAIVVLAFVAWEMAGLTVGNLHTLSFYAVHNRWLDYLISALFLGGGIGGFVWWKRHLKSDIPR